VALVCATREERMADLWLDLAAGAQRIPMRAVGRSRGGESAAAFCGRRRDRGDDGPSGAR
jgi:hypothetical protein